MNAATAWTHAIAPRQLAGFFLLAASACTAVAAPRPVAASATVVLPANVQPDSYRIDINPDVAAGRFSATVDVDLRIVQPTDRIVPISENPAASCSAIEGRCAESPITAINWR